MYDVVDIDLHDEDTTMLVVNAVAPLALLLVAPYNSQLSDSCLSQYYYGTHGQQNVFITDDDVCLSNAAQHLTDGSFVQLTDDVEQLVWLQHQAVDTSIKPASFVDEFNAFFSRLSTPSQVTDGEQTIFNNQRPAKLLHRTTTSALISVDSETALTLDLHLPRFWKASPLPTSPVPFIPVPSKAVDRVKEILDDLKFDPTVASIVSNISVPQLRSDVRYLTGEHPQSEIVSRHSFSKGVLIAADWLKANFEAHGASCALKPFLSGFAPNVIWCVPIHPHGDIWLPHVAMWICAGCRSMGTDDGVARTRARRTRRRRCSLVHTTTAAGRSAACAHQAGTTTGQARRRCWVSRASLRARASSSGRTSRFARLRARSRACTARATMRASCTRRARTSRS